MNIDKKKLLQDLKSHKQRMEWNCRSNNDYERGYLDALNFVVRVVQLQPESELGQVAFRFEEEVWPTT